MSELKINNHILDGIEAAKQLGHQMSLIRENGDIVISECICCLMTVFVSTKDNKIQGVACTAKCDSNVRKDIQFEHAPVSKEFKEQYLNKGWEHPMTPRQKKP